MLLLLTLMACKGGDADDSAPASDDSGGAVDTGPSGWDVPLAIEQVELRCDEAGLSLSLRTQGWVGSGRLDLVGPASGEGWAFVEAHPLPAEPVDYDPMGAWDAYALTLSPGAYAAGVATAVDCAADFTWRVGVFDRAGLEADCRAGGAAPEALDAACAAIEG